LGAREKLQLEHKLVALLDVGLPSDCLLVPPLHQQKMNIKISLRSRRAERKKEST
jgi:hypothetical protein